jgi:serine/threonine protein kinase
MAILPGLRLGPYEILSAIGAGGMGEVYRAKDARLNRIVAIKVLPSHLADSPGFLAGLRGGLSVGDYSFNLPQQAHDLLRLVPPNGHDQSSQVKFSLTSPGTKITSQVPHELRGAGVSSGSSFFQKITSYGSA